MDVWADSGEVPRVSGKIGKASVPSSLYHAAIQTSLCQIKEIIAVGAKGMMMKKPLLSIDEPVPKKAARADMPPTEGFATVVDGHFKSEFDTVDAAEASGRKLKSAYPYLQIQIYDAATKARTLLS